MSFGNNKLKLYLLSTNLTSKSGVD